MAFIINGNFSPQNTTTQPTQKETATQQVQNTTTKPQTNYKPSNAPLGNIQTKTITPSNSAFSSLFLDKESWLQKEFGLSLSEALGVSEKELDEAFAKADEVQGGKFIDVDNLLQNTSSLNTTALIGLSLKA